MSYDMRTFEPMTIIMVKDRRVIHTRRHFFVLKKKHNLLKSMILYYLSQERAPRSAWEISQGTGCRIESILSSFSHWKKWRGANVNYVREQAGRDSRKRNCTLYSISPRGRRVLSYLPLGSMISVKRRVRCKDGTDPIVDRSVEQPEEVDPDTFL